MRKQKCKKRKKEKLQNNAKQKRDTSLTLKYDNASVIASEQSERGNLYKRRGLPRIC